MSEDETSALWQTGIYVMLMVLVVFATVALWTHVNVLMLLGMPVLYFMMQTEWEAYKRFKRIRKKKEEREST